MIFKHKDKDIIVDEKANDLTILDIAQKNGIDIEGSCDMLDLATGLTLTSRLGCQIILTDKLDGLKISLPFVHNDVRLNKKKY